MKGNKDLMLEPNLNRKLTPQNLAMVPNLIRMLSLGQLATIMGVRRVTHLKSLCIPNPNVQNYLPAKINVRLSRNKCKIKLSDTYMKHSAQDIKMQAEV